MSKIRSKNEVKRKQILNAATKMFTEQGYASTSMIAIAKQADVSKQTVYSHFGNKEDLFSAAIRQRCASTMDFDFTVNSSTDVKQYLLTIAHRFSAMVTSKEALAVHKICAFESTSYPQLSALFYQAGPQRLTEEITQVMISLDALGHLSISQPKFAAIQFLHIMKGETWMRCEFNLEPISQTEIEEYLSNSVDFFMTGYKNNQH